MDGRCTGDDSEVVQAEPYKRATLNIFIIGAPTSIAPPF
jgi:hypothetical protein